MKYEVSLIQDNAHGVKSRESKRKSEDKLFKGVELYLRQSVFCMTFTESSKPKTD